MDILIQPAVSSSLAFHGEQAVSTLNLPLMRKTQSMCCKTGSKNRTGPWELACLLSWAGRLNRETRLIAFHDDKKKLTSEINLHKERQKWANFRPRCFFFFWFDFSVLSSVFTVFSGATSIFPFVIPLRSRNTPYLNRCKKNESLSQFQYSKTSRTEMAISYIIVHL